VLISSCKLYPRYVSARWVTFEQITCSCEVGFRDNTSASIQAKASLADLLVNLLHEPEVQSKRVVAIETNDPLYDEIDKLVLKHSLCMEVGYEEGDIIPLGRPSVISI